MILGFDWASWYGVILAVAAIVALEVHWSMDAKRDARTAAAHAAAAGAHDLATTHDSLHARHVAETLAADQHTHLIAFDIDATGVVRVTVDARARSYLLRRFGPTKSVSEVTVSASAPPA